MLFGGLIEVDGLSMHIGVGGKGVDCNIVSKEAVVVMVTSLSNDRPWKQPPHPPTSAAR